MSINDFFGGCYLIWSERKGVDCTSRAYSELLKAGLDCYAFRGMVPDDPGPFKTKGMRGCTESHLAIIKEAKQRKLESVLIAEDDVLLWHDFQHKWNYAEEMLSGLAWWDLFYFYTVKSASLTDNRLTLVWTDGETGGHLYAVHSRFYDRYIAAVEEGIKQGKMQDETLYELPDKIVYAIHPPMAGQAAGYSSVIEQDRPERFMPVELSHDELTKLSDQFPVEDYKGLTK